ncbi:hypothetical protein [Nocardia farcinica]|uniref:hypothetical protein n=1 Tax=Nocardia farcinica TaxID=37329 RepID=UPI0015F0358A|nr:hypothetical protein [Nocardia farcinica]MBA4855854.1 hypothetical protein [Nocardia farcinica]MBC9815819.1 hypothetical protein [Nocardia farcinica]MBF6071786.1 hypothetical protein [Nocardia farcinica]MBF6143161.1 hypothetical protein [Nocardia farcinica]MBF6233516.1 hypothetical protein [Nocardia farcinica]
MLSMFGVLCRLAGVNGLVALCYPAGARLLRARCDRLHPVSGPVTAGRASDVVPSATSHPAVTISLIHAEPTVLIKIAS